MAVTQDQVQIRIDFVTDESKAFAQTILNTKEFNKQIAESKAKIEQYQKQLVAAGTDEQKRATILAKIAVEENKVAAALHDIAEEAKKVAKIDLTKLTPAQLTERAKQLAQAMRDIPASAPQFKVLERELAGVNSRLRDMKNEANGIKIQGQEGGAGGGIFGSIAGRVAGFVAVIGVAFAAVRGIFGFVAQAIQEFDTGAKADAALKSRIESTAGAAGRSLEQLTSQAEELAKVTLFDDDQTKKGQELLLTFTNIRDEVFDETIPVLQDLSTVLGQDISTSAIQVGKALNDPIKGITALQRVGVTFSESQKTLIARLVETGDVAAAQRVILGELEKEFGGAARAAAEAGLGPYTVLQNRAGELKESLGELASRGLKPLQPILEKVVTFFEGLAGAIVDGKEATGPYNGAINATVSVLKFLGDVIGAAWRAQMFLYDAFIVSAKAVGDFIESVRKVPVIGTGINVIVVVLKVLRDALGDVSATWTGVVAAIQQGADNVANFFTGLVLRAQIFGKELELALSFSPETTARLTRELGGLKARQDAAKAGKSVGDAYTEARNAAIAGQQAQRAATPAAAGTGTPARRTADTRDPLSVGGTDVEDAKKRIKDRLDNELKAVEAATLRREVVLLKFRVDGTINEERYQDGLLGIQQRKYQEQLEVYRRFKQEQTVDALKVQKQLLEIEQRTTVRTTFVQEVAPLPGITPAAPTSQQDNTAQRLGVQDVGEEALLAALRSKFEAALITEQDYELQRLELKRLALAEEIAILQSATQPQVDEIRKREEEKAKVEGQISTQRLENEKRTEELRRQVAQAGIQATSDVFAVAAELLAQDDAARKKNASTIKTFQTAQVIVQGIAEVQKIWAGAASLGPIAGPIIGGIQTAVAVARTAIAINKIQSAKFQRGGSVDVFGLPEGNATAPRPVEVRQVSPLRRVLARFGLGPKDGGDHFVGPNKMIGKRGNVQAQGADGSTFQVRPSQTMVVVNKRNTPLLQRIAPEIGTMMNHMERAWVFGGKAHSEGGTPVRFSNGAEIEVERGEAGFVVEKTNTRLLSRLSQLNAEGGHGRPFFQKGGMVRFAEGGITNVNTNPTDLPTPSASEISVALANMGTFVETVEMFQQTVAAFPTEVKSRVVYTDIEDAGSVLDEVRGDAAI